MYMYMYTTIYMYMYMTRYMYRLSMYAYKLLCKHVKLHVVVHVL